MLVVKVAGELFFRVAYAQSHGNAIDEVEIPNDKCQIEYVLIREALGPQLTEIALSHCTGRRGEFFSVSNDVAEPWLERLESVRRGVYAGALGYLDLRGGLDLSVVIRTFVWKEGRAHLHVGGGVVSDSSPEGEYLESLDKARAPLSALTAALEEWEGGAE